MSKNLKRNVAAGFTLIELLIVVIILAILAAIVIPQFSNSTKDAQEATMDTNLATLRAAIELYKTQHNGVYPATLVSSGGPTCGTGGAIGAGAVNSAQSFIDQLTAASVAAGGTCTLADTNYRFGPYIRGAIPNDPISGKGTLPAEIVVTSAGTPITATAAGGYAYDTKSGQFIVNNTALDVKGRAYSTH